MKGTKLTKFMQNVTATGNAALQKRGAQLENKASNASRKLIIEIQDQINQIDIELEELNDMTPDTYVSLRPNCANWNACSWIRKIQDLKWNRKLLLENLEIAKATHKEYFGKDFETEEVSD